MSSTELALLGGPPAFENHLHVGRPNQGDRAALLRRLHEMLDRNWLTNDGPLVREFEHRIAEYAGVSHCVAMCNATVALEIAIRCAGLQGEVIVPSFTFVATAHALMWQEITPVFCDIDPVTHNLDPAQVERLITPRTTGIIGVHLWGRPCAIEPLSEIAARRGLTLLFDAAHAFGCAFQGKRLGSFGQAEVFSFHATKFLNSGEGGAVVTNDSDFAERLRLMRNFGFAGYDNVVYLGTNGKMTEACAAMGLTNLEAVASFVQHNRQNALAYTRALRGIPGICLLDFASESEHNFQYIVVDVDHSQYGLSRDDLVQVLHTENVVARRYFFPGCHRMEPYRSRFPDVGSRLPHTECVSERTLVLPTGMNINAQAIDTIGQLLRAAHSIAPNIAQVLRQSCSPR